MSIHIADMRVAASSVERRSLFRLRDSPEGCERSVACSILAAVDLAAMRSTVDATQVRPNSDRIPLEN